MAQPVLIAPSILSADFARLAEEIAAVEQAGADLLHVDVMDGHFVPNLTVGPPIVESLKKVTKLPLDVHLMITNADTFIPDFVDAGADYLTVHVEACPHLDRTIQSIKERGIKAGVTLNPATPLSSLQDILGDVDLVLIMSLPSTVDTSKVSADYKDGVLTIKLPVREEAKPKQIQVRVQG